MKGRASYLGVLEALQLDWVGTGSCWAACWISSAGWLLCKFWGLWGWDGMEKEEPPERFAARSR